jgi:circadian clock protein KaiC
LLEQTGKVLHTHSVTRKDRELLRKRKLLESKIDSLKSEFESTEEELNKIYIEEEIKNEVMAENRRKLSEIRGNVPGEDKKSSTDGKKNKK